MKEIKTNIKLKAVKLFLSGDTLDEIAQHLGIAKGSVVNIVDDFRNGFLPAPPGMTEYVDEMRHLVVDLKKQQTTVAEVKSCLKLHAKLQAMGINSEVAEQWLDICQGIASPTVSNDQFVQSALELAEITSANDLSYKSLVQDYNEKLKISKKLGIEIQQQREEIAKLKLEYKEKKEQSTSELNSITKAIATAQDSFAAQKDQLKLELEQYLAQNKLDWQKVNTAVALLNTGLSDVGLTQEAIGKLSKQIAAAGSLLTTTKKLEQQRDTLHLEVDQLVEEQNNYTHGVNQLKAMNQSLFDSLAEKGSKGLKLDAEIQSRSALLMELNKTVSLMHTEMSLMFDDLYIAHLIITFLFNANTLNDHDLDRLVGLMVGLRQKRLGVGPKQVKDASGKIVCECQVPAIHSSLDAYNVDIDQIREELAFYLMPLVKDKFVSKWDYEMAKLGW